MGLLGWVPVAKRDEERVRLRERTAGLQPDVWPRVRAFVEAYPCERHMAAKLDIYGAAPPRYDPAVNQGHASPMHLGGPGPAALERDALKQDSCVLVTVVIEMAEKGALVVVVKDAVPHHDQATWAANPDHVQEPVSGGG